VHALHGGFGGDERARGCKKRERCRKQAEEATRGLPFGWDDGDTDTHNVSARMDTGVTSTAYATTTLRADYEAGGREWLSNTPKKYGAVANQNYKRVASFNLLNDSCSRRTQSRRSRAHNAIACCRYRAKAHDILHAYGVMACTRVNDPLPASAELVSATGVRVPSANTRCGRSRRFS
jgi:hypothetical protein